MNNFFYFKFNKSRKITFFSKQETLYTMIMAVS